MLQPTKGISDKALFQSFCSGDVLVQKHICKEYFPAVKAMVCKNNGNEQDAQDIFQETLIAMCGYCKKQDFKLTSSLKTMLYSIARNCWLKQLEKNKRRPVTFLDSWEFVDVDAILKEKDTEAEKKAERIRIISKYLGMLEPKAEQIICLYYFEGKSMKEIAEILGFANADSVKAQKYKAIVHLREMMKKDGIEWSELF